MDASQGFLPGFNLDEIDALRCAVSEMTDAQIDQRFPANTGANLRSTNPQLYGVAARLFYEYGFSQREIAVICQISRQTVAGIIESENGSYSSRAMQKAQLKRIQSLQAKTFANLETLMADPAVVRRAGPVAIANIYKMLEDAADKIVQRLSAEIVDTPPPQQLTPPEIKYLEA
ncbi:MAG: hypothetical protein IJV69_06780 [Kiritimatiellae bacterium]|nr:hypothetical protein [Kiritimatiellia bacterium]